MKIMVINLPQSVNRRRSAEEQLKRLGLHYDIVEGVNGHALQDEEVKQLCDLKELKMHPNWLTKGGIGCTLSHLKAMKIMIDFNIDKALILEDDFLFCDEFKDIFFQIEKEPLYNEIILLGWLSWIDQPFYASTIQKMSGKYLMAQPKSYQHIIAAHAYILTKDVAEKIVQINSPIRVISDSWGYYFSNGGYDKMRCILPSAVKSANFASDLGYRKDFIRLAFRWLEDNFTIVHAITARRREKYLSRYSKYHFV